MRGGVDGGRERRGVYLKCVVLVDRELWCVVGFVE